MSFRLIHLGVISVRLRMKSRQELKGGAQVLGPTEAGAEALGSISVCFEDDMGLMGIPGE